MNKNVTVHREKYIGGSDLPSILEFNTKYGTSVYDFARIKAGIIPNEFKGNIYTRYGQIMEPIIRDYINAKYNCNYREDTVIDNERAYRGNTDGIDRTADIELIEIKTFGEHGLNVDYYEPQCQFYMATFNVNSCRLIGYKRPEHFYKGIDYDLEKRDDLIDFTFDESRIEEHIIKRDPNYWDRIEKRITIFKQLVSMLKNNPDMTEDEFKTVWYGEDITTLCTQANRLELMLQGYKDLEKKYKDIKDRLYQLFDENGLISVDTANITITKVNPTSYDKVSINCDKLQKDLPDIYEKYKTVKTTNRKGYVLIKIKEDKNND